MIELIQSWNSPSSDGLGCGYRHWDGAMAGHGCGYGNWYGGGYGHGYGNGRGSTYGEDSMLPYSIDEFILMSIILGGLNA